MICPSCGGAEMEKGPVYFCPACGDDYIGGTAAKVFDSHTKFWREQALVAREALARVRRLAEEWEREAARREKDALLAASNWTREALRQGAAFEKDHARRLRALLDAEPRPTEEPAPAPRVGFSFICPGCAHEGCGAHDPSVDCECCRPSPRPEDRREPDAVTKEDRR